MYIVVLPRSFGNFASESPVSDEYFCGVHCNNNHGSLITYVSLMYTFV